MMRRLMILLVWVVLMLGVAQAQATGGALRVAHFARDVFSVDIYVDGVRRFTNIEAGEFTDFMPLSLGEHSIALVLSGANLNAPLASETFTLEAGLYTLALVGSPSSGTLALNTLTQTGGTEGISRVYLYHGVAGLNAQLSVRVNGETAINGINAGGLGVADLATGISELVIESDGDFDPITLGRVNLWDGTEYLIAMIGSITQPELSIASLNFAEAQAILNSTVAADTSEASILSSGNDSLNDVLLANEEFSTFVRAIENSSPTLFNRLAENSSSSTVLVPTNQAFVNLAAAVGRNVESLLNDPVLIESIVAYHILPSAQTSSSLQQQILDKGGVTLSLETLLEDNLIGLRLDGETLVINGFVRIEQADIAASNGILHAVNNVLLPANVLEALGL